MRLNLRKIRIQMKVQKIPKMRDEEVNRNEDKRMKEKR